MSVVVDKILYKIKSNILWLNTLNIPESMIWRFLFFHDYWHLPFSYIRQRSTLIYRGTIEWVHKYHILSYIICYFVSFSFYVSPVAAVTNKLQAACMHKWLIAWIVPCANKKNLWKKLLNGWTPVTDMSHSIFTSNGGNSHYKLIRNTPHNSGQHKLVKNDIKR